MDLKSRTYVMIDIKKVFPIFCTLLATIIIYTGIKSISMDRMLVFHNVSIIFTILGILFLRYFWSKIENYTDLGFCNVVLGFLSCQIMVLLLLLFKGIPFYLNAVGGDYSLHTSIVNRVLSGEIFADGTNLNLHNFYPPLYHWISGSISYLIGKPASVGIKYTAILFNYISLFSGFFMWRRFLKEDLPAALTVTVFLLFFPIVYKPYEFLSVVVFVPWFLTLIKTESFSKKDIISLGVIGGLIFLTYYYWFFLLFLWIGLHPKVIGIRKLISLFQVLLISALVSSPYWAPYLYDLITNYPFESMNNKWLKPDHLSFNLLKVDYKTFIILSGISILALTRKEKDSNRKIFLEAIFTTIVFYLIGSLLIFKSSPILHMRVKHVFELILVAIASQSLYNHLGGSKFRKILLMFALVSPPYFLNYFHRSKLYSNSKNNVGITKRYSRFIQNKDQFEGKTFLTNDFSLAAFVNVNIFININAHYSHPASKFRERLAFLKSLNKLSPAGVCESLNKNKFDKIDYIFLRDTSKFIILDDNFPHGHKRQNIDVSGIGKWPCLENLGDNLYRVVSK